jgi:hypothetical protein
MDEGEERASRLPPDQRREQGAEIADALTLARELGRGVGIPSIPGFETHCFALKTTLWWHGGRQATQEFSDVFRIGTDKFALIAAHVQDSVDGVGAAHTLRAFLRAALRRTPSLADGLSEVAALVREDTQRDSLATLTVGILDCSQRELEFLSLGGTDVYLLRETGLGVQRLHSELFLPLMQNEGIRPGSFTTNRTRLDKGDVCLVLSRSAFECMVGHQAKLHDNLRSFSGNSEERFRMLVTFLCEVQQNATTEKACVAVRCDQ